MLKATFFIVLLNLCLPFNAVGQSASNSISVTPQTRDAVVKLVGDITVDGQAYEYTRELSDEIGPRLSGSAKYMQAAQWAEKRFKSLGLSNVHVEKFEMPVWEPEGPATGTIVTPFAHQLHIYSFAGSPSTPKDGVTAKVVHVPGLTKEALVSIQGELRDSFALLDADSTPPNMSYEDLLKVFLELEQMHIRGFLIGDVLPKPFQAVDNGTENIFAGTADGSMLTVPAGQIGAEDVQLIHRLMTRGQVEVSMKFSTHIAPKVDVPQIVGEIRGRELPDQIVVLGGHLDSWQPGTGAQDNGTGVATVLDVARAIQAQHLVPRRTVRFVLFGGEEQGEVGSAAYVRAHRNELDKIDAVLISDSGAGTAYGWMVMGRNDQKEAMMSVAPLLKNLGSDKTSNDV